VNSLIELLIQLHQSGQLLYLEGNDLQYIDQQILQLLLKPHLRLPVYGAFMNGDNVRKVLFPENLHLVMGNESNGITKEVSALITNKIKVKNIGEKAESLNVAIAASVLLYEICN